MLLDNQFTGDLRVENEVFSLQKAGFNVFVLCFSFEGEKEVEDYHGAKIIRLPINPRVKDKIKGLTNSFFDIYSRYWGKIGFKFVKQYRIDVLHVHDLILLKAGLIVKKKSSIPVVADLHENYPAALKYYKFSTTFPGKYLISISKWYKSEKKWLSKVDYLITVIDEAEFRYRKIGVPASKINIVANYVDVDSFLRLGTIQEISQKYIDKFSLLYAGGFDSHRGIEIVIRALPKLKEKIPNIQLTLIGKGRNMNDLKTLATDLGVEKEVCFEGWQPPGYLASYISGCNIALIPHLKTEHTDNTIPHKLFQYMLLEKPIISSSCAPLKRIINETKSGLIYEDKNSLEFVDKVIELYNSKYIKDFGERGRVAVLEKYNWKETAKTLIGLYSNIKNKKNM